MVAVVFVAVISRGELGDGGVLDRVVTEETLLESPRPVVALRVRSGLPLAGVAEAELSSVRLVIEVPGCVTCELERLNRLETVRLKVVRLESVGTASWSTGTVCGVADGGGAGRVWLCCGTRSAFAGVVVAWVSA